MAWTELKFGKHKGKTLPQVLFSDPDWFFWASEQQTFRGAQRREADLIYVRATHIRIPVRRRDARCRIPCASDCSQVRRHGTRSRKSPTPPGLHANVSFPGYRY